MKSVLEQTPFQWLNRWINHDEKMKQQFNDGCNAPARNLSR